MWPRVALGSTLNICWFDSVKSRLHWGNPKVRLISSPFLCLAQLKSNPHRAASVENKTLSYIRKGKNSPATTAATAAAAAVYVTLRGLHLDSDTEWTGELWSKINCL